MTVTILSNEDEQRLVDSLRAGDELAFEMLIDRYHAPLLRLAMLYVPSRAVAEEVVQETWLGVLQGLARFEGRSSLKTWIFRILTNRARTRGQREGRSIPFSAVGIPRFDAAEPSVEADRFFPPEHASAGHWVSLPRQLGGAARGAADRAGDARQDFSRRSMRCRAASAKLLGYVM